MRWSIALVLLVGCPGDDGTMPNDRATTGGAAGATTTTSGTLDHGSAGADEPLCIDAYHGNQDASAAALLELGTAAADISVDSLVVCNSSPSDFFALAAECGGYLSIEARRIEREERYMPDLVLYEDGQPIEAIMGVWNSFYLKPLQLHVGAGPHVLEVRHSGGKAQRYSLAVVLLPDSACR